MARGSGDGAVGAGSVDGAMGGDSFEGAASAGGGRGAVSAGSGEGTAIDIGRNEFWERDLLVMRPFKKSIIHSAGRIVKLDFSVV